MPRARNSTTPTTSGSEEMVYNCKKCGDGRLFTAAERDAHKKWHADNEKKAERQLRSSGSRTLPSPGSSVVFEEIPSSAETVRVPMRKRDGGAPTPAPASKKRRSNKAYDSGVIGKWIRGISG